MDVMRQSLDLFSLWKIPQSLGVCWGDFICLCCVLDEDPLPNGPLVKQQSQAHRSSCFIAKVLQDVKGVPVAANTASGWNPIPEGSS